jgi:hypothetical protein
MMMMMMRRKSDGDRSGRDAGKKENWYLPFTRWKGGSAKLMGAYKFYWKGRIDGVGGVWIMVANE